MNERKRVLTLILIMAFISLSITGVTISSLYRTAIKEEKERLVETAQSQARLIEAMARFDARYNQFYQPGGAREATLSKIIEAHKNYEQSGLTVEFTLADRQGSSINFLLSHRHGGLNHHLKPIGFDSALAEPMRQALSGHSGTVIGLDYRGEQVLAAHEPVSELDLGIVAKIDLSEIRTPFIKAGIITGIFAVLAVFAGATLFRRITNPMIRSIEEHNMELALANKKLREQIGERKRAEENLQKAHDDLETRVKERTTELSESNLLLSQEISERSRAEKELNESEQKYRLLVNNANEGITVAQDGFMKFVNPRMVEMTGYSGQELTSRPFLDFVHPDDQKITIEHHTRKLENPKLSETYNIKVLDKNGQVIWIENNGVGIEWEGKPATLNFITDITERRLFERHLIQKEKLASLGVLVSSIAHEINNPINFISFNIPILRDYITEILPIINEHAADCEGFELCNLSFSEFHEDIFKLLCNLESGADRISAFVANLREYSQDQDAKPLVQVDLKDVVERVLSICHSKIINSVNSFIKTMPKDLPTILSEPCALEHILINLIINATQAADKKESYIKLAISPVDNLQDQIYIEISDNGCGMDEETQLKIFDPFFTTKSPMDGTGLGLYICHTMVERLKGRIEVASEPGRGSNFKLILPVEIEH